MKKEITKEALIERGFVSFSPELLSYPEDAPIEVLVLFTGDILKEVSISFETKDSFAEVISKGCRTMEQVDQLITMFIS